MVRVPVPPPKPPPGPVVVFPAEPRLVLIPEFEIYYAPEVEEDIFFVGGVWWIQSGGFWYSSRHYNGPWVYAVPERVPPRLLKAPPGYFKQGKGPPGGAPPGQMKKGKGPSEEIPPGQMKEKEAGAGENGTELVDPVRETPFVKAGRLLRVMKKTGALSAMTPRGALSFLYHAVAGTAVGAIHHIAALNYPDKTAVIAGNRRLTYGELNSRINRLGNGLLSRGVVPKDRVIIMLKNCGEALESTYALARIRAAAVPVNPEFRARELSYIMENAGARAVIFGEGSREAVSEAATALNRPLLRVAVTGDPLSQESGVVTYADLLSSGADTFPRTRRDKDSVITILYTSGTTGRPKGAPRTKDNSGTSAFASVLDAFPFHHDDVHLIVGPLFHASPLAFMHFNTALGATIVIQERFDPEQVLRVVVEYRVSTVFMVPTMVHRILSLPEKTLRSYRFPSLKALIVAAAPFSSHLKKRALEYFGDVIYEFYGATETGINTLASPRDLRERPASVGRTLPATEIAVMDEGGRRLPPGQVGELFVRNEQTIAGYFQNDAATQKSRRGDFFSVGDLASMDREGYVYLSGRKVDMVISGGINVYPAEIEEVLLEHPGVADAAVVGIPDEDWGEALLAFIVPTERGVTQDDVLEFCRSRLSPHKKPKKVAFVEEIPRNATGKILKTQLRDMALRQSEKTAAVG